MSSASIIAENLRVDAIAVQAQLDRAGELQGKLKRKQHGIALGEAVTALRNAEKLVYELRNLAGSDRQFEGQ